MCYKEFNSKNFVKKAIQLFADSPFLIYEKQKISYKKFGYLVDNSVEKLKEIGLNPGERVCIYSVNYPEAVVIYFALWQIRVVVIPINTRWPVQLIFNAMKSVRSKKLIISRNVIDFPKNENIDCYQIEDFVDLNTNSNKFSVLGWRDFFSQQDSSIIFTSGSTGVAKAVLHSMENHFYSALGANRNIAFKTGDRWLICLPFYHIGGLAILFRAVLGGGAVIIPPNDIKLDKVIEKSKFTHISLVFTQMLRLLKITKVNSILSNIKAIVLGGSSFPSSMIKKANLLNLPIFLTYGSTEMSSQISITSAENSKDKLFTCGKPLAYSEIKITADKKILVRGKTLFRGYVEDGILNPARTETGWFETGDLGYFDENGFLIVTGRVDNMFISGGENIQPEAIERALKEIKGVEDAIVVAIENVEFGKRPVAFIARHNKVDTSFDTIRINLMQKVPHYAIPDHFFDFPSETPGDQLKNNRQFFTLKAIEMLNKG